MTPIKTVPVLVIGAGLSGLSCARVLAQRNISAIVIEGQDRVAQPWRNRHPEMRLNIHRHFARLPGQAAPRVDGSFLRRDTVVSYLECYAAQMSVPIHLGVEVTSITRCSGRWRVTTTKGIYDCAHVVIATGRERIPFIPDWPGRNMFEGEMLHAADLGDVSRFDGKRVLVVGAGNSGSDVLNHLARHSPAEVLVSIRHGPAVVPVRIFGFPLHRLARVFAALPTAVLDPAFRITQRLFLGDLAAYGLMSHPDGGGTRLIRDGVAFAMDDGFVAALKSGRFRIVPNVVRFDETRAYLTDHTTRSPDVVIAATGYRTGLTPLLGHLGVLDEKGQPHYPMGEQDPDSPGLWFTGFRPIFTGYFDAARVAADRISTSIEAAARHNRMKETEGPASIPASLPITGVAGRMSETEA